MYLRQSTASQEIKLGPFLDTDGAAVTGLTIANTDILLTKGGATTESAKNSGGATHVAAGRYTATLDATDTDTVGILEVDVHVSGALPVKRTYYVLEEAVYDALFAASAAGYLQASGTLATVTNLTNLPTIPTNWLTADGIAADAVTELQSGLATASALSSLDSKVDTVDSEVGQILADTGTDGVVVAAGSKTGYTLTTADKQALIELLFTFDATATYATADAGSVVAQIADNAGGSALTAAAIADAVWEEAIADHSGTAGSTAEQLAAAGAAGDPWATALPGSYTAGQAGKIIGDNINATISSRASQTSVDDVPTNAELATAISTGLATYDGPTNAEMVAAFTEIKGATWAATDTLEAIRDRGDSAWVTATGFSTFDPTATGVFLRNGAHGGTAAVLTLERIIVDSTTNGEPALKLTGHNSSAGLYATGGTNGHGVEIAAGIGGCGISIAGSGEGGHGVAITSGANADGLTVTGDGTGVDIRGDITGNITGNLTGGINTGAGTITTLDALDTAQDAEHDATQALLNEAVPDSVPADGSRPSVQQAVYMIVQLLTESAISGTTWTIKKPDGSTTLFTVTLDDATTPTSKTRAS